MHVELEIEHVGQFLWKLVHVRAPDTTNLAYA